VLNYSVKTDVGCVRQVNEDSFLARPDLGIWMVCDGMGGLDRGELASQMACETVCERIAQGDDVPFAIEYAHRLIRHHARVQLHRNGMGTTIVMLHIDKADKRIYWVGDSRAYQVSQTDIRQVTKDHSQVQEMIDAKVLSINDAKHHPHRHLITQSVGVEMQQSLQIGTASLDPRVPAQILLCSDGLSNELDEDEILGVFQRSASKEHVCADLIEAAKQKSGRDNITAMLIEVF
jgi:protein phosphatase